MKISIWEFAMNKIQRNETIFLQELNEQKIIDIKEAMRLLDVSESTVRGYEYTHVLSYRHLFVPNLQRVETSNG